MAPTPHHPGKRSAQGSLHRRPAPRSPAPHSPAPSRVLACAAALCAALALTGCQGLTNNSAQLRVIDASPDAGLIDSYQNNAALAYNLGFGTSTSYIPMSPGVYTLAADKAGTRQTLAVGAESLAPGKQYTEIVSAGLANLQQTLFLDQSTPAPAGQIAVRIINETTRAGALDVYLIPMAAVFGKPASVSPLAANLSFGANSGYINLPEGTYAIDVVPAGTARTSSTATLLSGAQLDYASGTVRTVVLIDQETLGLQRPALTPGVQAIIATDADAL